MKSGSEQLNEDFEGSEDQVSERTPLLESDNVAPTTDPKTAEALRLKGVSETSTAIDHPSSYQSENASSSSVSAAPSDISAGSDKPLPVRQILLLCFARLVEPISFFSIFPFINQMCQKNGNLNPADTGFYSGLIESLFSLTQMIVMIAWGRLSDRFGRKPVLVISLTGVAFATALFGLATTIWQMILFRCVAGVFAGSIVTIRTMITEHSTAKTQARSFSWFAFSGNLGILFGPLIGGALADPAGQYHGAFEHVRFFKAYPYALATLATGSIALVAAVTTAVFVEETLSPKVIDDDSETESTGLIDGSGPKADGSTTTWSLLKTPGVAPVLYLYSHIMVLAFSYTAIVPVFWYEPVSLGGFGFSSAFISIFMGLTGAAQAIWLLLIFPPLQHRIGTGGVLRGCAYFYPLFFIICPLLNALLREGSHTARIVFWVIAPILLCLGVGVSMSFTAIQLALNDVSPSPRTLGTLNALALTLISGIRAFSPAAFTSLFAVGVRDQILKGYLAWAVMIVLAGGLCLAIRWLPEKAEGKISGRSEHVENGTRQDES